VGGQWPPLHGDVCAGLDEYRESIAYVQRIKKCPIINLSITITCDNYVKALSTPKAQGGCGQSDYVGLGEPLEVTWAMKKPTYEPKIMC